MTTMTMRAATLALALCAAAPAVVAPATSWAQTTDEEERRFKQLVDDGKKLYKQDRLEDALKKFEEAYEVKPSAKLLFNMGLISERLGKLEEAEEYYDEFVTSPDIQLELRAKAQERLDIIRPIVRSQREKADEERRLAEKRRREDEQSSNNTNSNGNTSDDDTIDVVNGNTSNPSTPNDGGPSRLAPIATAIVGGAAAVTGAVLLVTLDDRMAFTQAVDPNTEEPSADARRAARLARRNQLVTGNALTVGGGLVTVGGLIWLVSVNAKAEAAGRKDAPVSVLPTVGRDNAGVQVLWRF